MRGLDEEREYAERCRVALEAMIAGVRENVVVGEVTWGDRYTAERLGYYLKSLARELGDEGTGPPFFGRITYGTDESAGDHRGQTYYLGRRHISDAIGRPPLVIDWRAPVSTAFYQATPTIPQGLTTRRRFGWSTTTLTAIEDEPLTQTPPAAALAKGGAGLRTAAGRAAVAGDAAAGAEGTAAAEGVAGGATARGGDAERGVVGAAGAGAGAGAGRAGGGGLGGILRGDRAASGGAYAGHRGDYSA